MSPLRHILIADDDRNLRESLCEVLTDIGWQATPAACGSEAIKQLELHAYDLLLSDVDMPDMTGFQLLAWARDHHHAEPTVLMSARADQQLNQAALKAGALSLLPKPVHLGELSLLVQRLYPR